jgi:glycosyltransferase involved in cell wall biosynthesis
MKKISVIIPSYNYSEHLDVCLLSVVSQRVNCYLHVLISDDSSTDDSFGVMERIKSSWENDRVKISIFKQEKNLGEIKNTKFLLDLCDGDYIAYLDADDYWIDPDKLQKQIDFLENNLDYSMCFTGYIIKKDGEFIPCSNGSFFLGLMAEWDIENMLSPESLSQKNFVYSSSRFFRNYKNLYLDYFEMFSYSDWAINFELSLRGKIKYMDYPSYVYTIKSNSLSTKNSPIPEMEKNYLDEIKLIFDKRILESKT